MAGFQCHRHLHARSFNYGNTSRDLTTAVGFLDANLATPESTDPEEGTPLLLGSPTSPAITQGVIMPPASW